MGATARVAHFDGALRARFHVERRIQKAVFRTPRRVRIDLEFETYFLFDRFAEMVHRVNLFA
jgi:hypothetical protein